MRSHRARSVVSPLLRRVRAHGQLRESLGSRSMEMMKAIQRLSEQINAQSDQPVALDTVINGIGKLLATEKAAVYLIQSDGELACAVSQGIPRSYTDFVIANPVWRSDTAAFGTGSPLVVKDVTVAGLDEPMRQAALSAGIQSYIIAPLANRGKIAGFLAAYHSEPREYHPEEIDLAMAFAGLAAAVITNARLYAETKQRERDATFLSDTSKIFDSSLELPLVLQAVVERAKGVVGDTCSILLVDREGQSLEPIASSSTDCSNSLPKLKVTLTASPIAVGSGLTGRVVATGKSCLVPDYQAHQEDNLWHKESNGLQSYLATPISAKGRVLGVLLITTFKSSGRVLGERDLRLASSLAERAAIVIESARLFEQVIDGKRVWEQTFDAITDGISIHDQKFNIIRANKAFASSMGMVPRQVIGRKCFEIIYHRDTPCQSCPHQLAVMGQPVPGGSFEKQVGERYVMVSIYPLKDANGNLSASVHVMKDITEQKVLQEQLIRSERLRALGEMASGVAHNFNNLLAAILGRAELLLMHTNEPRVEESLKVIRQAALDGAQTVRRIQDYTRIRKDIDSSLVNLNEVVLGAIELSKPKWKDEPQRRGVKIELSTELKPTPLVGGNPSELREVLVNLIFNAVDAMPTGGQLLVQTGQESGRIRIRVCDSGIGMADEVQKRIFDPFYTTKGQSGNGLGLSIAYGIVTRHGGEISVSSVPGEGSAFTVMIPRAHDQYTSITRSVIQDTRPARILIVDDEVDVLNTLDALLSQQGHSVIRAASGSEALQQLESSRCDVVITDLGMPEMNGWDLGRAIKQRHPEIPVALFTGWGMEIDPAQMKENGIDRVITKPCGSQALRAAISEMLVCTDEKTGELKILVVDDEKRFGEVLAERLQLDGHEVRTVTDGSQCLSLLESWQCDTLFADYKLPDITGVDLAKAVRERCPGAFIVLMTGFAASLNDPAFIGEVDAVLPKPWKQAELEDTLSRAWALKKRREGADERTSLAAQN